MDHSYIEENNIADLYLMGRLASEEAACFEIHFLSCPECVQLLEDTGMLRTALREFAPAVRVKAESRPRLLIWLGGLRAWQQAALITAILLLAAALPTVLFIREIRALRQELNMAKATEPSRTAPPQIPPAPERPPATTTEDETQRGEPKSAEARSTGQDGAARAAAAKSASGPAQPQVNTPIFVLNAVRSGTPGTLNEILVSHTPQWFLFSLELESEAQYSTYRATIFAERRTIWRDGNLRPNRFNTLTIGVDSSFFHAGDYLLTLEGLRQKDVAEPVGNYPFHITKQP